MQFLWPLLAVLVLSLTDDGLEGSTPSPMEIAVSAMVYNVDWSGKLNANAKLWGGDRRFQPAFHNVASFLAGAMSAEDAVGPVDFVTIPEGSTNLRAYLEENDVVPDTHGMIAQDEHHCGLGGMIVLYSKRFKLQRMSARDCPRATEDPVCGKRCPKRRQLLQPDGDAGDACGSCTAEVGRPLVVARFKAAGGASFLVAGLQMGHTQHADDLARVAAELEHLLTPADQFTLLVGDFNTHYGMRDGEATLDKWRVYRNELSGGPGTWSTVGTMTWPLPAVKEGFASVGTVHAVGPFEPVTCCCPAGTPWRYNAAYGGAGCAGKAPGREQGWFHEVRSQADVAELERTITDEACGLMASVLNKAEGSVVVTETDVSQKTFRKVATPVTVDTSRTVSGRADKYLLPEQCVPTVMAPGTGNSTAVMAAGEEFKFDQMLVLMSNGLGSVKTLRFALGLPTVPASDHFPLLAKIQIPLAPRGGRMFRRARVSLP